MKKLLLVIIGSLVGLYLLGTLTIYLTNKSSNTQKPAYTSDYVVPQEESLESRFKTEYMEGCSENGAYNEYCSCSYDGLVGIYGFNGLLDNVGRLAREEFSEADMEVINRCSPLLN